MIRSIDVNRAWIKDQIVKNPAFLEPPAFVMTAESYIFGIQGDENEIYRNPQTVEFCNRLSIDDYINTDGTMNNTDVGIVSNPDEIVIEDSDDENDGEENL
jgi:hypothetical protein